MERDGLPASLAFLARLMGTATALWGLWCVAIAFMGGILPIPGMEISLDGGVVSGLTFLLLGEPLLTTLAYWLSMIILVLIYAPFSAAHAKRQPQDLISLDEHAVTMGTCAEGKGYFVVFKADKTLAVAEMCRPRIGRLLSKAWPLESVDIRAGLFAVDAQYIFISVLDFDKVIKIGGAGLDDRWAPVIGKAVSSPAPQFSF